MNLNYMALAIPVFLMFIGLEYLLSKKLRRNVFNFTSSITNMNVGLAERLIDMFTAASFYVFYEYVHEHYAIFDIRSGILTWVSLELATDLVWYWYHRFGHEINIFWGFHVVHHTSEEFNSPLRISRICKNNISASSMGAEFILTGSTQPHGYLQTNLL